MKCREASLTILRLVSLAAVAISLGALGWFLFRRGIPAINRQLFFGHVPPIDALLARRPVWDGIWPALAGTSCVMVLTLVLVAVPGLACGAYLASPGTSRLKSFLGLAVDLVAGVPSIVMGLFGFEFLLLLRRTVAPHATTCLLLAAGCLALLTLPTLALGVRASLAALPTDLALTGRALGMSEWQTLRHLLLPAAGRGVLSSFMLVLGRAAEDTAVIMLTGVVASGGLPGGLLGKFETLSFFVFYKSGQYLDAADLNRAFGAAVSLLAMTGVFLLVSWHLRKGMDRSWRRG